jgi:hypothetical protein
MNYFKTYHVSSNGTQASFTTTNGERIRKPRSGSNAGLHLLDVVCSQQDFDSVLNSYSVGHRIEKSATLNGNVYFEMPEEAFQELKEHPYTTSEPKEITLVNVVTKKFGTFTIDVVEIVPDLLPTSHPLYQMVEQLYNEWYDNRMAQGGLRAKDTRGMYFGEGDQPAIYSRDGAIVEGMNALVEYITERERTTITSKEIWHKADITAVFE